MFNYDEFRAKVDTGKPVHHCLIRKCVDSHGLFYRLIFRVYGVSRDGGHVIVWHTERRTRLGNEAKDEEWFREVERNYAEPLGSTAGLLVE